MKQKFMLLVALTFLVFGFMNIHKGYAADKDCPDFASQKEAQIYFLNGGGSKTYNFNGLDRDHDGVACENQKGYTSSDTYYGSTLPQSSNGGGTSSGDVMPDTATYYPASIIFGIATMVMGVILFIRKKAIR